MITIDPNDISTSKLHSYLLGAVAPRPIAFASTMDEKGNPNLSPFSFFNVFSANPPILIFSPSRKGRDNTTKHTHDNAKKTKEVVINIVNYDIVQQMSLSSTAYPERVNEFKKAGLTMLPSELVKPFRVAESPVQFECKVKKIIELGNQGGAGNLVICEVLRIHIEEAVLDAEGTIDQHKIDLVSRMGGNWYSRANKGMFEVPKPLTTLGIGVDMIPNEIRLSSVLTGNDLGKLGNIEQIPSKDEVDEFINKSVAIKSILSSGDSVKIHQKAQEFLNKNNVLSAWKVLLAK